MGDHDVLQLQVTVDVAVLVECPQGSGNLLADVPGDVDHPHGLHAEAHVPRGDGVFHSIGQFFEEHGLDEDQVVAVLKFVIVLHLELAGRDGCLKHLLHPPIVGEARAQDLDLVAEHLVRGPPDVRLPGVHVFRREGLPRRKPQGWRKVIPLNHLDDFAEGAVPELVVPWREGVGIRPRTVAGASSGPEDWLQGLGHAGIEIMAPDCLVFIAGHPLLTALIQALVSLQVFHDRLPHSACGGKEGDEEGATADCKASRRHPLLSLLPEAFTDM
mmetsp:Transcript_112052/g.222720  ORF Transcript_112052/g.222720 Transcript_112052/m.222720 type:complete len:272 (+) Transcript_112052:758-1573(+)